MNTINTITTTGKFGITEDEEIAIKELRLKLEEISLLDKLESTEDRFLVRWLRARNLDLKNTLDMLKNYIEWKTTNEDYVIAHREDWTPNIRVVDEYKYKLTGFDEDGRPILWFPIARYDVKGLLESGLKAECFQYSYTLLDEILATLDRQAKMYGATQFVCIIDSAELTLRKITHYETIQCLLRFAKEFDANYPELLHSCYIVNSPWIFSKLFNIVKPILSKHTLSKINIFDSDDRKWKKVLLDKLPPESVPEEYGGTGSCVLTPYNTS